MYAAETLFNSVTLDKTDGLWRREPVWKAKGTVTIRRWRAGDVKVELKGRELKPGRRAADGVHSGHPHRKPYQVEEAVPLFRMCLSTTIRFFDMKRYTYFQDRG
jgi:hypothetical protein